MLYRGKPPPLAVYELCAATVKNPVAALASLRLPVWVPDESKNKMVKPETGTSDDVVLVNLTTHPGAP